MNTLQSHSQNDSGDLRRVAGGDGKLACLCEASVMWVIMLHPFIWVRGQWLWLPFVLLFVYVYRLQNATTMCETKGLNY